MKMFNVEHEDNNMWLVSYLGCQPFVVEKYSNGKTNNLFPENAVTHVASAM